MTSTPRDYSVFAEFKFERKPVGVKFLLLKPEGIKRLDKSLFFCEMFKEAQGGDPFYVGKEDWQCVERLLLGMEDPEPMLVSGFFGEKVGLFKEARANRKIYQYLPKMLKGSVNYVAFSPIDQLPFDPDVLVVTASPSQAQMILRALGYSSGEMYSSRGTPVAACSWLYIYPVISGELNYTVTGFSTGMKALQVLPEGLVLISIPWNKLPMIMENLRDLNMGAAPRIPSRDEHVERVHRLFDEFRQEISKR
ncbi:MAG: DUF169 domain-containing protein [Thermodesulfobacteriota bacterium]